MHLQARAGRASASSGRPSARSTDASTAACPSRICISPDVPKLSCAIEGGAGNGDVAPAETQADLEVHALLGHVRVGKHEAELDDLLELSPLAERPTAVAEVPERALLLTRRPVGGSGRSALAGISTDSENRSRAWSW
jgi:hypothetical protein